jgi:hypothetical protein
MIPLPIICSNGIGDSFLVLGRVPIAILGKLGFRFSIFYTTAEHPARKTLEPFFRGIRYCEYKGAEPTSLQKWFFSKMMSLSMRTSKIWKPPFDSPARINGSSDKFKRILLHTHLDGHHGWKGATAKMWPMERWVELCNILHSDGWKIALLEWDENARSRLLAECPFLSDGRRLDLLQTVLSFDEYDFVFSIDSWSKYAAAWFDLQQVVAIANLQKGYVGFDKVSPERIAKWWFHGLMGNPKVKVLGLENRGNDYFYTYCQISEMGVNSAINAITKITVS